jgi:hypothetical protein
VMIDATVRLVGTPEQGRSVSLGQWYSEQAARLGGMGVDFGLTLRNRADAGFHHEWYVGLIERLPMETAKDRVLWESLNRVIRVLNHLDAAAKASPQSAADASSATKRSDSHGD